MKQAVQSAKSHQNSILELLKRSGYADITLKGAKTENFTLLPLGKVFLKKLRAEWTTSFLKHAFFVPRASPIRFPSDLRGYFENPEVQTTFEFAQKVSKELCLVDQCEGQLVRTSISNLPAKKAEEQFQRLQRERKIWWMKLASEPCNLEVSEIQKQASEQRVSLNLKSSLVEFLPLETITFASSSHEKSETVVQVTLEEQNACQGLFEDSVDGSTLDLHRRLVPFQIYINYSTKDASSISDLHQIGRLMAIKMMKANIAVLDAKEYEGDRSEDELELADRLGIPYVLRIENETLQNGVIRLRNRKTKTFESIHLRDVPSYIVKILQ